MASVFVLLEAFNRKEAAALGFFPCATAPSFVAKYAKMRDNTVQQRPAGGRFAFIAAYFPSRHLKFVYPNVTIFRVVPSGLRA